MKREVLRSKIQGLRLTETHLNYQGSFGLDQDLIEKAGLQEYDRVLVLNHATGARLETYLLALPPDSGRVALLGPAARVGQVGDELTILAFGTLSAEEDVPQPAILTVSKNNRPTQCRDTREKPPGPTT